MFLIRADGNAAIGAGHLMRCMSVAEELAQTADAGQVFFVCADEDSAAMAESKGFASCCLRTDYRDMESEFPVWWELMGSLLRQGEKCRILVDSYFVTDRYLADLREFGTVTLMDDLGRHPFPVDCVVNYNASARLQDYEKLYEGREVRLLVGSSYIPLRRQFPEARQMLKAGSASRKVKRILITTGGGDIDNIAGKILETICQPDLEFDLILGRFSPHFQDMKALEKSSGNIHIHYDVENMAKLMMEADIALTAGGSTIYELAALGVPFICFSYAENQEQLVDYIEKSEIAGSAGAWHRNPVRTLGRIKAQFQELLRDSGKRAQYSRNEMVMVDGQGAARLAAGLLF